MLNIIKNTINRVFASGVDSDASAFITATGLSGTTQKSAITTLVKDLKSSGLWSKMKAVYPMVTDNYNLLSYTEDFSNAYWFKQAGSITANTISAPNSTTTADSFFEDPSNSTHGVLKSFTLSSATAHTYSVYVKQLNGREAVIIRFGSSNVDGVNGTYIGSVNFTFATQSLTGDLTRSVEALPNGWYRLSVNVTPPTTALSISLWSSIGSNANFAGDVTKGFYIWGAQLEASSTVSTYQPIVTTPAAFMASQMKYNLKDARDLDAAFRLTWSGGWTYSATGATPNGTNAYADTKFNQENNWTSNTNAAIGFYSRTDIANAKVDIGALSNSTSGTNGSAIYSRYSSNIIFSAINSSGVSSVANLNSLGFFIASRDNSIQYKIYKFGTTNINTTQTSSLSTNINRNIYLGAANDVSASGASSYLQDNKHLHLLVII